MLHVDLSEDEVGATQTRDLECVSEEDDGDGGDDIEKGRHDNSVSGGEVWDGDDDGEEVIICIGAGVGITPFLSSLDAMLKKAAVHKASGEQAADVGRKKKVWLYWLTRNAGDFLTGVSILKQLSMAASRMLLKGSTALPGLTEVHLRLHVTAAVGPLQLQKPSTFLFHESLQKIICIQSATAKTPFEQENKHAFICDIPTASSMLHDTSIVDSETSESTRESAAESNSIPIRFGRPCWVQDFTSITIGEYCRSHKANKTFKAPTRWVYLCGNTRLQADVADACRWVSNETGHKFVLMCEEF
ncbi:hypothetical protein FOL47_008240 [Perkinsus chesapeaki]|uniref:Ferric reductase NAD binding domain-containing protein n=1 Tax=Perkinsus chesapeaki TaxID=330153 RepID=A0A7J6LFE0_PERCH|nr:hypothetical protein FOL47_008240 [Perkinsus chesapeaki]